MSILRIKELEQQLKRRDDRLADIEDKIKALERFEESLEFDAMHLTPQGCWFYVDDVLECFR
jgi:CII-binding regulator of phage lambda lysogenization HflD